MSRSGIAITLLIKILVYVPIYAQSSSNVRLVSGSIVDSLTQQPVEASIQYQSLPYGSISGVANGHQFQFVLYNRHAYDIWVKAFGYQAAKLRVDALEETQTSKENITWNVTLRPQTNQFEAGKIQRLDNLIFRTGTARIESTSFSTLDEMALILRKNKNMIIRLEGHTDTRGNPALNLELSKQRVSAVKKYLVKKGAPKSRIKTKAFGGTQPINLENSDVAHRQNRRVEVRVLKN